MTTVTITNARVTEAVGAINQLLAERLPARIGYALGRTADGLARAVKPFNDERKKLIEAHCDKDADGEPKAVDGQYSFADGGAAAFEEAMADLLAMEVPVEVYPVPEEELTRERSDAQAFSLSPGLVMPLLGVAFAVADPA